MHKAVITGASNGLGLQIATLLVDQGVEVINISTSSSPATDIHCDLSNKTEVQAALEVIRSQHQDTDILILNAGVMPREDLGSINTDIDKTFAINTTSAITILDALTPILKKNAADIIIVGSTASYKNPAGASVYNATKAALQAVTRTAQNEFRNTDVRVTGFYPGGFNSNLRGGVQKEGYMDPADLAAIMLQILQSPRTLEISEIVIKRKSDL
mgnify:CR=1 FL=1